MRLRHSCLIAAVAGMSFVSAANATLSVSVVPVNDAGSGSTGATMDPNRRLDDPALASTTNFARTFEIAVTQGAGEKWSFGTIKSDLAAGTFYSPGAGKTDGLARTDALENTVGKRYLQADTWVSTPDGGNSVTVLGKSDYPANQTGLAAFPGSVAGFTAHAASSGDSSTATSIDITWGNQQAVSSPSGNTTYSIGRFTVLGLSAGTLVGHIGGTQHNFTDVVINTHADGTGLVPSHSGNGTGPDYPFDIPVPFDFNVDGQPSGDDIPDLLDVFSDIGIWQGHHPTASIDFLLGVADLNGDGAISGDDFPEYLAVLGGPVPTDGAVVGSLVPEPTSLALLSLGAMAMIRRRR